MSAGDPLAVLLPSGAARPSVVLEVLDGHECAEVFVPLEDCPCGSRFVHLAKLPSRIDGREWRAVEARCSGCASVLGREELTPPGLL